MTFLLCSATHVVPSTRSIMQCAAWPCAVWVRPCSCSTSGLHAARKVAKFILHCAAMVSALEASSTSDEALPLGLRRSSTGGSGGSAAGGAFQSLPQSLLHPFRHSSLHCSSQISDAHAS